MATTGLTEALTDTLAVFERAGPGTPLTTTEVCADLDVGRRSTYDRLSRLADRGHLETKEVGAKGRVWWRAPDADTDRGWGHEDQDGTVLSALVDAVEAYAIFVVDPDGSIRTWNSGARTLTGYDREAAVGEPFGTLYPGDDRERSVPADHLNRARENGPVRTEGWRVRADGSRFRAHQLISPIRDGAGALAGFAVVVSDASERHVYERRPERGGRESDLEAVFDRIDDGFYGLDADWQFTVVNDRAAALLDLDGDATGSDIRECVPLTPAFEAALERAYDTQQPVSMVDYYEPLDAWYENTIYPSSTGLSVNFRDVTDREQRERELERYETIVETLWDGVYALDDDERFVLVNDSLCDLAGYEREELLGRHASVLHSREVNDRAGRMARERADERDAAVLDFDLRRKDGETIPVETRFGPYQQDGDGTARTGVIRDVTHREHREQQRRERLRQQEVVASLGQRALEVTEPDDLTRLAAERLVDALDADNASVLALDAETGDLQPRHGEGWPDGIDREATIPRTATDAQAAYTLTTGGPEVVPDLRTDDRFGPQPFHPDDGVRSSLTVAVGAPEDRWGVIGVHDAEPDAFSESDTHFVQAVASLLSTAVDRHESETKLRTQRERLAAVNRINVVVRSIIDAVIEQSTRESIEETLCEALAASESFEAAWLAGVDRNADSLETRAGAGGEGVALPTDSATPEVVLRARQTGETQVVEDAGGSAWCSASGDPGAVAAIPVVHEDVVYGVLCVCTERADAFVGEERRLLTQLGEVAGHAISAADRKRSLMSDEVAELEFRVPDLCDSLGLADPSAGRVDIENVVPTSDGDCLLHGAADEDGVAVLHAHTEVLDHWEAISVLEEADPSRFEARLGDPPIFSEIAARGGRIDGAVIEDGNLLMRVHVAPGVDTGPIVAAVQDTYPTAEMVSRTQRTRSVGDPRGLERVLEDDLTDRQRETLETAFHEGYFDWPRLRSGEEIAGAMGVARPTFQQHLRVAERKLLGSVLAEGG